MLNISGSVSINLEHSDELLNLLTIEIVINFSGVKLSGLNLNLNQLSFIGLKGSDSWSITKLFGLFESQMIHQPDPDSPVDYRVILGYDYEPCVHKVWAAPRAPTVTPTPDSTPPNN